MQLRRGKDPGQGFPSTLYVGGHYEFIGSNYEVLGGVDAALVAHVSGRGQARVLAREALQQAALAQFPDITPSTAIMRSSIDITVVEQGLMDRLLGRATVAIKAAGDVTEYYGANAIAFGYDPVGTIGVGLAARGDIDGAVQFVTEMSTEGFNDQHLKGLENY
ncbi:MAG: hypothetical protein KIH63_005335 [Candidatus Saccharibacteria bacterium]|nr:hypothetical protein [Candidatus Saccharibacteria bacterium]